MIAAVQTSLILIMFDAHVVPHWLLLRACLVSEAPAFATLTAAGHLLLCASAGWSEYWR